jgi:hypothetical protein
MAATEESLFESSESTEAAPTEAAPAGWFLADGVEGQGEKPEWYNEKYQSVAEQAKGYNELSKKLGGFTGPPEEGYKLSMPEEWGDMTNPDGSALMNDEDTNIKFIKEFGANHEMSQGAFDDLVHGWIRLTVGRNAEVKEEQLKALGPQGKGRLDAIDNWVQANIDASLHQGIRNLVVSADSVDAIEALIKKTRPAPLVDTAQIPTGASFNRDQLMERMADPRYQTSKHFRQETERLITEVGLTANE